MQGCAEKKKESAKERANDREKRRERGVVHYEWNMRILKWEENRIVYDIGLQMTYKNTLCVKLSMHLLSRVKCSFYAYSFISKGIMIYLYFGYE